MSLLPRATERLSLRPLGPADVPILHEYRNDPDVARQQDWPLPYTLEHATKLVDALDGRFDVEPGTSLQIGVEHDGRLIGDLYVGLEDNGGIAEIGYSFTTAAQGHGFAREAVGALVDALFTEVELQRVHAGTDPTNLGSIRLLEALGFEHVSTLNRAFLLRGTWVDDTRYSLDRDQWEAWRSRPTTPPDDVRLVAITSDSSFPVSKLVTHHSQQAFVATVLQSYADALFPEDDPNGGVAVPWLRAIEADGELVGFVMLSLPSPTQEHPYLWRFLIDRRHQRRGVGQRVIRVLTDHLRSEGATALDTSWELGRGSPEPFYRRLGFEPTGEIVDGEIVGRLDLTVLASKIGEVGGHDGIG